MRRRARLDSSDEEINLTPLIDVVFVILIMFIVIAPLLQLDRVELAESTKEMGADQKSRLAIHVYGDNSLSLNHHPITPEKLQASLKQAHRKFPDERVQLFHDREGSFGTYQMVKDAVADAGFSELDVILKGQ